MYTQCPHCLTIYRLDGETIAAARGSVRCSDCAVVFDALATLAAQLPPEPIERLPAHLARSEPPQLGAPVLRPNPAQIALFAEPATRKRGHRRVGLPTFARGQRPRSTRDRGWLLACTGLLLLLGVQIAWSERARWIDDPRVRSVLEPLCAQLHCSLPLRHEVATLELLSRDIHPHPSVPDALVISATLRNDAPFAQAWPTVEVSLSNLDDKKVAMRRFQPHDYLADGRSISSGIAAGASAALVFEVVDPGNDAVAFEFSFK